MNDDMSAEQIEAARALWFAEFGVEYTGPAVAGAGTAALESGNDRGPRA